MQKKDVIIIGAGAAGLMCGITAGQRGRSVAILDHANKVGKKILMSGGGRCNFTNYYAEPTNFLSHNQHFCKSALSRYTQWDFIALVEKHGIPYHEKKLGQLFCDNKAKDIVNMLLDECAQAGVEVRTECSILQVDKVDDGFIIQTSQGKWHCQSLVIATGGLSIPTMGATGFGYDIAKQFGLKLFPTYAALVPFTLTPKLLEQFDGLSGTSADALVSCNGQSFRENILFTHRGLSGPSILQISSYWQPGDAISINLFPDVDLYEHLKQLQQERPKAHINTVLAEQLTKKLADRLCEIWFADYVQKPLAELSNEILQVIAEQLQSWQLKPTGTEGYRTAEVTMGGLDTDEVSSKTFEAKKVTGLYFIGEVLDVTGHLGGFNFQWAWASGYAAGQYV
ncbi:BaiN/RdsA family NAD(P)/FAD-dependent oxidoreductase [Kangiella koreensis]|uniref:HI0933 family protein n=1 Tax=Kangiella koreensis (strain DSM 16069 / JCM 12317 / KCTC 12182 / SW-125) TaxID=523791 RepID=C7RD43_KANKD|nr:NAD(P)/FAD-dependent oxidoreductase [Kangiella koreensis]ACV27185.1 HI0933 family protein [Kangiella koreensis DSM 16069]